jgi:hypothetical protein
VTGLTGTASYPLFPNYERAQKKTASPITNKIMQNTNKTNKSVVNESNEVYATN